MSQKTQKILGVIAGVIISIVMWGFIFHALDQMNHCMAVSASRSGAINVEDLVTCNKVLGPSDFQRLLDNASRNGATGAVIGQEPFYLVFNGQAYNAEMQLLSMESPGRARVYFLSPTDSYHPGEKLGLGECGSSAALEVNILYVFPCPLR